VASGCDVLVRGGLLTLDRRYRVTGVDRNPSISVQNAPSTLVVTLPIHPYFGRQVQVWRGPYRRHGVGEVVDVELPDGIRRQLPIAWTDRRPSRRCPVIGSSLVLFDAARLLEQIPFVKALAEKLAHSCSHAEGVYPDPTRSSLKPEGHRASARGPAVAEPEATPDGDLVDGADDPPSSEPRRARP
jgi:hypothetical protein